MLRDKDKQGRNPRSEERYRTEIETKLNRKKHEGSKRKVNEIERETDENIRRRNGPKARGLREREKIRGRKSEQSVDSNQMTEQNQFCFDSSKLF
jgi:hypothetical protein